MRRPRRTRLVALAHELARDAELLERVVHALAHAVGDDSAFSVSYDTTEVAEALSMSPAAVRHAIHSGGLPARWAAGRWVVDLHDLVVFSSRRYRATLMAVLTALSPPAPGPSPGPPPGRGGAIRP